MQTWMMKGVSFFLLIALSSIVSGTERLIILLKQKLKNELIYFEKDCSHKYFKAHYVSQVI